ncbi:hypothetical protein L218DRAFT_838960, partial [Marasmius fiardii PR-910]
PIYLFILPFAINHLQLAFQKGQITSIHMWSFDEMGKSHISDDMCKSLGLPTKLFISDVELESGLEIQEISYPTEVYKRLHNWQGSRGFDPATTDFARHCGF